MSDSIFVVQPLYTLESPKIEAIAYSSISETKENNVLDGSDPNELCIFTALKGGRLFEHTVKAEPRNESRTVCSGMVSFIISLGNTLS